MSGPGALRDVTLRPWPAPQKEELKAEELKLQIGQLTNERGHVRNITEKSLQDDIIAGNDVTDASSEQAEKKPDKDEAQSRDQRRQDVARMQLEMLQEMEWVKFAATNAIDIISLVLSADPKKRTPESFTQNFRAQGLEQGVPYGSFGMSRENHEQHVRKIEDVESLQEYAQRQELVAKGSRMQALDTATDDILKAAKKLEREVRRETKYWQEVVSISDKGWRIQRLRPNVRNSPFAVRYGLPEASRNFRASGLAPLRMDRDGSIMLDPALKLQYKTLRVRISENGTITGTSCLSFQQDDDKMSFEKTMQLARDSLFEEELYHEMSIESRQLLAYGVEDRDSVLHVDASGRYDQHSPRKLLIDLIPRADGVAGDQHQAHDWLAKSVAEGLRLLLAHEHNMRLYRRSQLPRPLSSREPEDPRPALLRTVLAVFKHMEGVDSLYRHLETTAKTLQSAGIAARLETTREVSWARLAESLATPSKTAKSASDRLLDVFLKPFEGQATLSLPPVSGAQSEDITISTRTIVGQPIFGTEHMLTLPSSVHSDLGLLQHLKFSSVDETTSYMDWLLSLHIAHRLLKRDFSPRTSIKGTESRITIRSRGIKKVPVTDYDVRVEMQNGELKVLAMDVNAQGGDEVASQSHTWTRDSKGQTITEMLNALVG